MKKIIWIALLVGFVLLGVSSVFAQGDPKTVVIRVWNQNGTDYPTGADAPGVEDGLAFFGYLKDASNGWAHSDTCIPGGPSGAHYDAISLEVHHISILCGNFTAFNWVAGDSLIVKATDVEDPYAGESNTYRLLLNGDEQQDGPDFALPVVLSSFTAIGGDTEITLRWRTECEMENIGFHLYRSLEKEGEYVCITRELIRGMGSSAWGEVYTYVDKRLINGRTYWYKLEDVAMDGTTRLHGPISAMLPMDLEADEMIPRETEMAQRNLPASYVLHQNAPNPFNSSTMIRYRLLKSQHVSLVIYDVLGSPIRPLVSEAQSAGYYEVPWDGRDAQGAPVGSGTYLARMEAGELIQVCRMMLLR